MTRRIRVLPSEISGDEIRAGEKAKRHAIGVLRMREGDVFAAIDGAGTEYEARITAVERDGIRAEILSRRAISPDGPNVVLYVCMIRPARFETILEKATEEGVSAIIPVVSERTQNYGLSPSRRARWESIISQATRQSAGCASPVLGETTPFDEALDMARGGLIAIPDPSASETWPRLVKRIRESGSVSIFIGPEGGFTEEELRRAVKAGATPVSFGRAILRTETAAIAAAAIARYA